MKGTKKSPAQAVTVQGTKNVVVIDLHTAKFRNGGSAKIASTLLESSVERSIWEHCERVRYACYSSLLHEERCNRKASALVPGSHDLVPVF